MELYDEAERTHGGWEALYGPDTRTKAYHEARARAERLGLEAAPVDLTKARAAAHADGAREALGKLRRGRSLDDVEADYPGPESFGGEDYPMEAAEQQAPMYRCGCADCPGLPWSPSSSLPHPCGKAAPAEPADCECAMGSARWCSVHGDCTCPRSEDGGWKVIDSPLGTAAETEHDPSCPLLGHGAAEPPAVPPQPEPAPLVMPAAPGPVMVPVPTTAFSNSGVDYSTNYSGPAAPLQGGRDGGAARSLHERLAERVEVLRYYFDREGMQPLYALLFSEVLPALAATPTAPQGPGEQSEMESLRERVAWHGDRDRGLVASVKVEAKARAVAEQALADIAALTGLGGSPAPQAIVDDVRRVLGTPPQGGRDGERKPVVFWTVALASGVQVQGEARDGDLAIVVVDDDGSRRRYVPDPGA